MKADAKEQEQLNVDLCIIGAGSAGLTVAAGAAQLGAKVVLIERGKMGGDCLNYGCVPSKALLAAAKRAHIVEHSAEFGLAARPADVDFAAVMSHVHQVIAAIAPHDSVERFEGFGVRVIQAEGRFTSADTVEAGGAVIRARRFVIATGSRAFIPPIPGLRDVPYLTNETVFENRQRPGHLIVLGGGPIGMEMAQAHRRLGAKVTVIELGKVLPKDDPELTAIVADSLTKEGVVLKEGTRAVEVKGVAGALTVVTESAGARAEVTGSHLLVAAGRIPNLDGLGLEAAGIAFSRRGVDVDQRLRSTNKRIFAIGDAAGSLQFTHVAGYHGGLVIRNALFRVPARASTVAIPWCTYTDPELAHVGLTEAMAKENGIRHRVLTWSYKDNDRAQAERRTEGRLKAVVSPGGRILGCSIVGAGAGDLILPWVMAIGNRLKIGAFANIVAPYPTYSEVSKRAGGSFYTGTLFSPRTRLLVKTLLRLG